MQPSCMLCEGSNLHADWPLLCLCCEPLAFLDSIPDVYQNRYALELDIFYLNKFLKKGVEEDLFFSVAAIESSRMFLPV